MPRTRLVCRFCDTDSRVARLTRSSCCWQRCRRPSSPFWPSGCSKGALFLMQIGPYPIRPALVLAPMAGVTDKPFRLLCKQLGAGYAVSEMTSANPRLWETRKSQWRMDHTGEPDPIGVQIAGADP